MTTHARQDPRVTDVERTQHGPRGFSGSRAEGWMPKDGSGVAVVAVEDIQYDQVAGACGTDDGSVGIDRGERVDEGTLNHQAPSDPTVRPESDGLAQVGLDAEAA